MKKYEFTGETKTHLGINFRQIRALVTIAGVVNSGDAGGWIQEEKNLDQYGDAWVSGDAQVYGNARVSGDAQVYGNAQVYGDARVYGNALVSGNAWVSGDAQVSGSGSIFWASKVGTENGTITVFSGNKGQLIVTRGCFVGSDDDFLKRSKQAHDEKTHREYCLLIEVAKSRIKCNSENITDES